MMENVLTTDNKNLSGENYDTILKIKTEYGKPDLDEISYGLSAEDGKNLFLYLKNLNLIRDPELLILPPNNHYYFDEIELQSVRTIVNLKNLNLVRDLDAFLYTLMRLLPPGANFVGHFSYNKFTFTPDGIFTGLSTRINNLLDSRTNHNLDEKELSQRLKKFGFRVVDMTEMNGLIFFCSQNIRQAAELRA
jgi:hypothetical protein